MLILHFYRISSWFRIALLFASHFANVLGFQQQSTGGSVVIMERTLSDESTAFDGEDEGYASLIGNERDGWEASTNSYDVLQERRADDTHGGRDIATSLSFCSSSEKYQ